MHLTYLSPDPFDSKHLSSQHCYWWSCCRWWCCWWSLWLMPRSARSSVGSKMWLINRDVDTHSDCGVPAFAAGSLTGILPHSSHSSFPGWSFSMGSAYQFHSWRVFVIVCALPCVSSVVALTFMPESPRFLLEVTLVTNTQRSHICWKEFLIILRKYVCLLARYIFPSYYGTMEGLVSWRHAFSKQHVK